MLLKQFRIHPKRLSWLKQFSDKDKPARSDEHVHKQILIMFSLSSTIMFPEYLEICRLTGLDQLDNSRLLVLALQRRWIVNRERALLLIRGP